jgi:hypothetical protein
MEHVGYDPNVIHGSVHTLKYNHTIGTQNPKLISQITTIFISMHQWFLIIDFYIDNISILLLQMKL